MAAITSEMKHGLFELGGLTARYTKQHQREIYGQERLA